MGEVRKYRNAVVHSTRVPRVDKLKIYETFCWFMLFFKMLDS